MDHHTTPINQLGPSAFGFVVNSWVRSWWQQQPKCVDGEVYYNSFPDVARIVARRGDVLVAHFEDNPDTYIGWIAFDRSNPRRLHYVYVKESFRRSGVAHKLLHDHLRGDVEMSLNPVHRWKREKAAAYGYRYNPYQLMLIGDVREDE